MKSTEEKLNTLNQKFEFEITKDKPLENMRINLVEFFNNLNKIIPFRDLKEAMNLIDDIYFRAHDELCDALKGVDEPIFDYFDFNSLTLYRSFAEYILTGVEPVFNDKKPNSWDEYFAEMNKPEFEHFKNGTHDIFINPKFPDVAPYRTLGQKFIDEHPPVSESELYNSNDEEDNLPF